MARRWCCVAPAPAYVIHVPDEAEDADLEGALEPQSSRLTGAWTPEPEGERSRGCGCLGQPPRREAPLPVGAAASAALQPTPELVPELEVELEAAAAALGVDALRDSAAQPEPELSPSAAVSLCKYKVLSADGCLVRSGAEKTSAQLSQLAQGEIIEVAATVLLDSGVTRCFFRRADLEGWISAGKDDGTPLLERLQEPEQKAEPEPVDHARTAAFKSVFEAGTADDHAAAPDLELAPEPELSAADKVSVFSKSANMWCDGEVLTVDPELGQVKVEYMSASGVLMQKVLVVGTAGLKKRSGFPSFSVIFNRKMPFPRAF